MRNWKHWAGLYLLGGAGIAGWAYFKGYAFQPMVIVTWPTKIGVISALPKTAPGNPRATYS